jgi:hypothetical protein
MAIAVRLSNLQGVGEVQKEHRAGFGPLVVFLAEFRRAAAAERRYDELKRTNAVAQSGGAGDPSRRIFDEFYAS